MRSLVFGCVLMLAGPALAETDEHVTELDGAEIVHPWAQASDGNSTRVFLEIHNSSDQTLEITGGTSPDIAETVTVMAAPIKASGVPQAIGSFPISAQSEFALTPDSVYLLLDGVSRPLVEGDEFEMTLTIAPYGEVEIHVEIEASEAENHSHAGHNH